MDPAAHLSEPLATYATRYRAADAEAGRYAESLSDAQFNWKPAPDAWSVAECLMHLVRADRQYLPLIGRNVARSGKKRGAGPFRYGWMGRLFIRASSPGGPKLPSPPSFRPDKESAAVRHDRAVVRAEFASATRDMEACLTRSEGLHLAKIRVPSPVIPLVWIPLGAVFEGLVAHEERHLAQARRVTEHAGFPSA